jgi:hypothetical protein
MVWEVVKVKLNPNFGGKLTVLDDWLGEVYFIILIFNNFQIKCLVSLQINPQKNPKSAD